MKKVFLMSVAGDYIEGEDRRPQYPSGSVYTQQGQLFAVLAMFENHDGIEKLVKSVQSNNSTAVKAANAAIRKLELANIHFENGKTVTYARLSKVLRDEGRVVLWRTDEYDEEDRAYIVWKMGVNEWPNIFTDQDLIDPDAWWNRKDRIVQDL
jgi:hypothetical protein